MKRKIVALLMSGIMVAGLCSCSMLSPSKFGQKKVAKFFEEELDGKEIDADDMIDALDDHDVSEFKKGEWATLDKKQTKNVYKACDLEAYFSNIKAAESSVAYMYAKQGDDGYKAVWAIALAFANSDDIDDFFDDTLDQWDELSKYYLDFDTEEEDDYIMAYFSNYGTPVYLGVYRSGNNVLLTLVTNDDETLDDMCDYFEIESPTSLEP